MSETVLEIHLPKLRHNYTFIKKQLSATTKLLAIVKAFGYGSDAVEVAKCLVAQGVDYLGVAYTDEGVTIRNNGVHLPILVLKTFPGKKNNKKWRTSFILWQAITMS